MTLIQGNNVFGYLDDVLIFCGKTCTFREIKDTAEGVSPIAGLGIWRYNRLQKHSWSFDVTGLTKVDSSDGQLDYFTLITDPYSSTFHNLLILFEDQEANTISISGTVYCSKSTITGPNKEFAGASATFIGTGPYELSTESSGGSGSTPCTPIAAGGAFTPPDGTLDVPYSYTLILTGTSPKTLGAISGNPGWMTISVATGNLVLGGTPTDIGDAGTFFLDIVIDNDCGSIHLVDEGGATINFPNPEVQVINDSGESISVTSEVETLNLGPDENGTIQLIDGGTVTNVSGTHTYTFLTSLPSSMDPDESPNPDTLGPGGVHNLNADISNLGYIVIT